MRPRGYPRLPFLLSKVIVFCLQMREKSGEGGIRTHEAALHRLRDFQSRSLGQLGHLSVRSRSLPDAKGKTPHQGATNTPGLPFGAPSEDPDREPDQGDEAEHRDEPATRIGVGLYVLFFVLLIVVVVEEPGPEKEVG
jgi:hypothetical protein